jgi:RNA polymerase sigma-70 factor (ECF subfamily)
MSRFRTFSRLSIGDTEQNETVYARSLPSMTDNPKLRLVRAKSNEVEQTARPSAQSAPVSSRGMVKDLPDESLVALAIEGDTGAAEELYRRHAAFGFNLAARIAGTTTDVEDVVHDAFLRAFDGLEKLRNPKAFKSWLGSIVVHSMRSRLRRARWLRLCGLGRSGDSVDVACIASDEASPRVRAELAQVYALLQTISPDDRIAWTLRFVEGHDLKDAAELAGCSLATIKRRIRRAQSYVESHFVKGGAIRSSANKKSSKNREEAAS